MGINQFNHNRNPDKPAQELVCDVCSDSSDILVKCNECDNWCCNGCYDWDTEDMCQDCLSDGIKDEEDENDAESNIEPDTN